MASGRVVGIVGLCAAAAVVAIVGGTVLLSRHESTTPAGAVTTPRPGRPVLQLELGLRRDIEAQTLREAQTALNPGRDGLPSVPAAALKRYTSVEARLALAVAHWTGPESLSAVKAIVADAPDSAAARLNLGWANYQAGRNADAAAAWEETAARFPDSPYAVDALNALHPTVAPGLPPIVVDPAAVPAKARQDLTKGVTAWNLKRVLTARRLLDAAAKLAPHSPEALVAAAVARFSPAQPTSPFPILGPLTAEFPDASIVRLHLGELLLWKREVKKGKKNLRIAAAKQPRSIYAQAARAILKELDGLMP